MTTPARLPGWTDHLPAWLPNSLADLHGPREGVIDLPLDLCWSGQTAYNLGSFRQRMALYELVIVQGMRNHYPDFLDADLLIEAWPLLHRRLGYGYMQAWEDRFPELARLGASAEAFAVCRAKWENSTWR